MKMMKMFCLRIILILGLVVKTKFGEAVSCQNFTKCHCIKSPVELELQCPKTEIHHQKPLSARIKPGTIMEYMCPPGTSSVDYSLLSGFYVGELESVVFQFCPLPNAPLKELFESMNITGVKLLVFQSHLNLTDTLLRSHLEGLKEVRKLTLSCNNITKVPDDLFADLVELIDLDLRENSLQLSPKIFEPLTKLDSLELGDNHLRHLEPGIFSNLSKLRLLNLWSNELHNISRSTFTGLKNLESLDLNSNGLASLPGDVFAELANLKELSLYGNRFIALPAELFSGNKELAILKLYDNRQKLKILPSGLLSNLTKLKQVYLGRCSLEEVPNDLFWGSTAITNISFQGNALTTLPPDIFSNMKNLKHLDLSYNRLASLPNEIFFSLKHLLVLRLGSNQLTEISETLFSKLEELYYLDLEHNGLNHVHHRAFVALSQLQEIHMSHNNLTLLPLDNESALELQSPFHGCIELVSIYLTNNSIPVLFQDWVVTLYKLERLYLSHNKIQTLDVADLQFISDKIHVDLQYNQIEIINLKNAEEVARATVHEDQNEIHSSNQVYVLLEGNPVTCDCNIYDVLRYLEGKMDRRVRKMVELAPGNLTCITPSLLHNVPVTSLKSSTLTCAVDMECPETCVCKKRPSNKAFIVDCSNQQLSKAPEALPLLLGTNHTELNISHNGISFLPNLSAQGYENVTHIDASHNNISQIEEHSISHSVEVLDISYNNVTWLSSPVLELLSNATRLKHISLYSNPWDCDCDAHNLISFIHNHFQKVLLLHNMTCNNGQLLANLTSSDICYMSHGGITFGIGIAIALLGVITGLLAALYYRYQHEIKVWLYAHNLMLWWVTEEELDKDKLYDAFISYSHKDEDFVVNQLVPELEGGPRPFKLCLHYRDWIAGEWIPNQIARSVEDSRRTVVVLSPCFLESVWGRMEFRTAHSQALSERRARVIVILYGDIGPLDDLNPELRAYLTMNTYVKWGDPWFWDKLRYALPHPTKSASLPLAVKPRTDDKLELIDTLAPAVSTEASGHVNVGFVKAA